MEAVAIVYSLILLANGPLSYAYLSGVFTPEEWIVLNQLLLFPANWYLEAADPYSDPIWAWQLMWEAMVYE